MDMNYFREHLPLLIALALGILLLFPNLGDRTATGDEAYTLIQAKTVLEHGYPYPFYRNFEILPKATYRLGDIILFNWTPWLESYIAAAMEAIAGFSEFWLRFPFALLGLATIALTYVFARKLKSGRFVLTVSLLLLVTSVTFLLHARQARWYVLSAFFALATWYTYWLWLKEGKAPWLLIMVSALLFHSQIFIFFAVMFSLVIHYIVFERKTKTLKQLIAPIALLTLLTLPWFILTGQLASKSGGLLFNPLKIALNLALYGYYTFALLVPVLLIVPPVVIFFKSKSPFKTWSEESRFTATITLSSFFFLAVKGDLLPAVRYLVFIIPLFSIVNAYALAWFRKQSRIIAYALLIFIIATNYLNIAPSLPFKSAFSGMTIGRSTAEVQGFIDASLTPRAYFFDYLEEITNHVTTVDEEIIKVMKARGSPSDTFATSHFTHTILLYTNMAVAPPNLRAEAYAAHFNTSLPIEPDWIIPRGFVLQQDDIARFMIDVDARYNISNYEPITININDDEQWASAPDPINHKFKTDRNGTLTIYRKTSQ